MKYEKIIFVDKNGTSRAVMAERLFDTMNKSRTQSIIRGLLVAFAEPVNPKAEAMLASDDIDVTGYKSKALENNDIDENTIIFAMDRVIRDGVIASFENANSQNTFEICGYIGEELELTNPYGANLTTYGICYESLKNTIKKLIAKLEEENE